jgi:sRNA-binding carbon storage regulator CsrA
LRFGEFLCLGDNVRVKFEKKSARVVWMYIDAPRTIPIVRREIAPPLVLERLPRHSRAPRLLRRVANHGRRLLIRIRPAPGSE